MKIYIGGDHAGYETKAELVKFLREQGNEVLDMGADEFSPLDDYPDFIRPVAEAVAHGTESRGIILGGSGQGEAICANRVHGARAVVYYGGPLDIVVLGREHNNANILSLGARFVDSDEAREAVKIFLSTPFSGEEKHLRRIKKIDTE